MGKKSLIKDVLNVPQATKKGYIECPAGGIFDSSYPKSKLRRARVQGNGYICPALTTSGDAIRRYEGRYRPKQSDRNDTLVEILESDDYCIRKLTPAEHFRLMGMTETNIEKINKAGITKNQQYKLAGNSIVIDLMIQLFKPLLQRYIIQQPITENIMANLKGVFLSGRMDWGTPSELFEKLNSEFHFNLDPCALPCNAKCEKYYTPVENGLEQNWGGYSVFCNPPYGRDIRRWVKKCYEESKKPRTTVVLLIPARTDTTYFHDYIYHKVKEIRFLKGRIRFDPPEGIEKSAPCPFPSMVVVF